MSEDGELFYFGRRIFSFSVNVSINIGNTNSKPNAIGLMKETFYRYFWQSWGFLRNKENDSEQDCPCCGLDLPWPQAANLSPEKVTTQTKNGRLIYHLEGIRTCPRCCHQWSAVISADSHESYAVGSFCELPVYGDLEDRSVWSSPATT
jgi:hypothetical protein